jgi:predicted lipoprotein with Yx(FWY)xxD motif
MKTNRIGRMRVGALAVLAAVVACIAGPCRRPSAKSTVSVVKSGPLGSILVGSSGRTLYRFLADHGKTSSCSGSCAALWPPLTVARPSKPVAGRGVKAKKLGTITRSDGAEQVTYNGYPLYRYAADKKPAQVKGQGVFGKWYVLAPSGATLRTSTTATSSSSSSSGGGYGY